MKKIYAFSLVLLFLASCGSVNKKMQRGDYDGVISKSVKKLIKNPNNTEYAEALDRAYRLANERDLERIKFLKMENNDANYDEVFRRYESLKNRQARVRPVLPLNINGRTVNYEYVDYDAEAVTAKKKAAQHYYDNGRKLLQNGDKESYRQAYYELIRAQEYSGDSFPGLNEMILDAKRNGMSRAIVGVTHSDRIMIAPEFRDELLTFNTQGLNSEWVEYHFRHLDENTQYDYEIIINILDILVSPEEVKTEDKIYKKEIEDGFNYALDANGNVMKDTAGNDIKILKYKTIQATLIETYQRKAVTIRGQVEITRLTPDRQLLVKEPIAAENVFENVSARAVGDEGALDGPARAALENEYVPFPPDGLMILNTSETLKPAIRDAIYRNRRLVY